MSYLQLPLTRVSTNDGYLPVRAKILRKLLELKQSGQSIDLWMAFPQNCCCFSFGSQDKPLPIGTLFLLWPTGWPYRQECPECKNEAYMISFGGLLSIGGGHLVCPTCSSYWFQTLGGLGMVAMEYLNKSPIVGTEFKIKSSRFGGAFTSQGEELRNFLGLPEPLENESGVSLTVDLKDGKASFCQTFDATPNKFAGGTLFKCKETTFEVVEK